MSIAKLTRALLPPLVLLAAVLAPATPASAVEVGCAATIYRPDLGAYICLVAGADNLPGNSNIRTTGGNPGCFLEGMQIPCRSDAHHSRFGGELEQLNAYWNAARQCFIVQLNSRQTEYLLENPPMFGIDGTHTDTAGLYMCHRAERSPDDLIQIVGVTYFWAETPPPPPTLVNPADLAAAAISSMGLTAIDIQIAPEPVSQDSSSRGRVYVPVWLWTEATPTTWGCDDPLTNSVCALTAEASALGVTVSASVGVNQVVWDMGDGQSWTCTSPGTPYQLSYGLDTTNRTCGDHQYNKAGSYTVTATSNWIGDWSGGGQSGTAELDLQTSDTVSIGEIHQLRTNN